MNFTHIDWTIIKEIEGHLEKNDFKGYDPYDFIGNDFFVFFLKKNNVISRKLRGLLSLIEEINPLLIRKLFFIKKRKNNKSLGLLAYAFLVKYEYTKDEHYLIKAEKLLNYLLDNPSLGYYGLCWGYPFHWYSRLYLKKNTPSTVVTTIIALAFYKHIEVTKSNNYLEVINRIKQFYLEDLNLYKEDKKGYCFSYTPSDTFKVHNANLFTGLFFAHYYSIYDDSFSKTLCNEIVSFVINEQNLDGSFNYWSGEKESIIDHFHTGYVLRHLNSIIELTSLNNYKTNLEKGIKYFLEKLYSKDGHPKFSNNMEYPIDCHSVAESILCLVKLQKFNSVSDRADLLLKSMELLCNVFYDKSGSFNYQIKSNNVLSSINYIRWSQSWAYLALIIYKYEYENRNVAIN